MALVANALTTVATLAGELGIATPAASSAAEADLERRIAVASSAIERYCGRVFAKATLTEAVSGYGTRFLRLSRPPLISITSVDLEDVAVSADDYRAPVAGSLEADAGLLAHVDGPWEWTAMERSSPMPEPSPATEQPLYEVVYVGGYVLPKDEVLPGTPRTLPYEVEEVCLATCVQLYRSKGRDRSIISESLLSASVSYAGSTANTGIGRGLGGIIPDDVLPLLAPYRLTL
jgi:hypothetical protein